MQQQHDRLYRKIIEILESRHIQLEDLQRYLQQNGFYHAIDQIDSFATPDIVRLIASYLKVLPSEIFEATLYFEDYAGAYLDERLAEYGPSLNISREEAWKKVTQGRELRSKMIGAAMQAVKQNIDLTLDGLAPPRSRMVACSYPDCNCPGGKCPITGRMQGPDS